MIERSGEHMLPTNFFSHSLHTFCPFLVFVDPGFGDSSFNRLSLTRDMHLMVFAASEGKQSNHNLFFKELLYEQFAKRVG